MIISWKEKQRMRILFNDMSEMAIQAAALNGAYLEIKTIAAGPAELREIFEDENKTRRIKVYEQDELIATYDGYTVFYRTEEYAGQIYGVAVYRPASTPEAQMDVIESAVKVARIQAQGLDDEQALNVQNLYPIWSGDGVEYAAGYKVNYEEVLYKCLQAHASQVDWNPADAHSLWTKVLNEPGAISDWEQPSSANPYMKGDKVKHAGTIWESLVDNNVWEPGAAGTESLWKEVS